MYDNLNNYRVFYTIANTGSISKAAEVLFISQPAISKSIAKLEEGIGVKLFCRTSRGVTLTEEGQILYDHIAAAFDNISKGEDEIKHMHSLGIGQLRIGASTSLCKHILLDYLQSFITENPHIKVIIDCHSTRNTLKLLQEGNIDLGLICETDIPKGFVFHKLTEIHDVFVTSDSYLDNLRLREHDEQNEAPDNPWLFVGNLTSMLNPNNKDRLLQPSSSPHSLSTKEILEKSNLMMLEKNNVTRTHIDNYLESIDVHPNQILEINNMDLLIDFASIGMGVASIVKEFATDYLSSGQIIELPMEKPISKRNVGFIYPETKNRPSSITKFLTFCEI